MKQAETIIKKYYHLAPSDKNIENLSLIIFDKFFYINYNYQLKGSDFMDFTFERKINYYETDRMGIVHHSNYIRFLEEARCQMLEEYHMPYSAFEEQGIIIPVLGVSCDFKHHVTFNDIIQITPFVKECNGIRLTIGYNVINKENGKTVLTGETIHCFTDENLKPIRLQKRIPEFYQKFIDLLADKKKT